MSDWRGRLSRFLDSKHKPVSPTTQTPPTPSWHKYEWPSRFLELKRELVSATTQERLTASWNDILGELATRTAEIAQAGPNVGLGLISFAVNCWLISFNSFFPKSTLQTWTS